MEYLAELDDAHLSVIARSLGIPKSSCLGILGTLEEHGYVARTSGDAWRLTLRPYHLGLRRAQKTGVLVAAPEILEGLQRATRLTVHLGLLQGSHVVYAHKVEPEAAMVRFGTYVGKGASLHLTAIGQAIVAHTDSRTRDRMLKDYHFEGGTERACGARDEYERRLAAIRVRTFAVEIEEEENGVRCVAAPVFDHEGQVVGAIGVTGIVSQIPDDAIDARGSDVVTAARMLSQSIGWRYGNTGDPTPRSTHRR
jgi:DNA-binding IclR family transcriptional regulator